MNNRGITTNKEKAQKLAEEHENATSFGIESPYHAALGAAIDMAEWKDRQYAEEKKHWIEKAADYIYTHSHVTTFGDIRLDKCSMTQFVKKFKKAMEE